MTEPSTPPQYALVADYELRTGTDVPTDQEPMIQVRLDDYSQLMALYMGPCASYVEEAYPDILTSLCVTAVQRSFTVTPGVRSESIGSTSVSYLTPAETTAGAGVGISEAEVLDALMAACCPLYKGSGSAVGQLGVRYDAAPEHDELWVMSRW